MFVNALNQNKREKYSIEQAIVIIKAINCFVVVFILLVIHIATHLKMSSI